MRETPSKRIARACRATLLGLAAVLFIAAGLNHFRNPAFYQRLVPPGFPSPAALVNVSGIAEIVGGIGLLVRSMRRLAGWGLIALLIAVFPANLYMAVAPERFADLGIPQWALWLRLPLQGVFIAWIWYVALAHAPPVGTGSKAE